MKLTVITDESEISKELPYIFIDSVLASNILTETDLGHLDAILKAGLAKLRAALTPGNAKDLDTLLRFMAPQGGGVEAVNKLIQTANQNQGDLTNNNDWWNGLFQTFGVQDEQVRNNIMDQVRQNVSNQPTQPQQPTQQSPPELQPPEPQQPRAQRNPELLNLLRQERQSESDYQSGILKQIADIRQERSKTQADIAKLRKMLDRMTSRTATESIYSDVMRQLFCEYSVINCMPRIVRQITRRYPILTEAGLMDKLRGAIKGGRNLFANPHLAKQQLAGATTAATNKRAAKLAVQLLTDHLRTSFEMKLSEAGMTPDQIASKLRQWDRLKQLEAQSGDNPSPKLVEALLAVSNDLKKIFELFQQTGASEFDMPATGLQQQTATAEQPGAESETTNQWPPLSNRQKALLLAASIAGVPIDKDTYHNVGPRALLDQIANDVGWARLMHVAPFRQAVVDELRRYPGAVPERIPVKARIVILKRIFNRINPHSQPPGPTGIPYRPPNTEQTKIA